MPSIPKISLQTPTFQPATFQATTYTPQTADLSLLQRSLDKIEERQRSTDQQRAAITDALGKVKLNAAEDEWKANYIAGIQNEIDQAAQLGDYSTALKVATRLAGEASSNPALLGRIRANEQFEKEKTIQQARRDKGEISQNTYDWWEFNNPYKYEDKYDSKGNIIGGSVYEPTFRPVADINWASTAMAAFKLVTPDKNTTSRDGGSKVTNNTGAPITRNGKTYKPGESIEGSSHSSQSQEKVTKEQITARMEELLKATGDGYRQAEQAFDVSMHEFKNMVTQYEALMEENPDSEDAKILGQKIDERKKLMYRNGSKIDYKEYYARMVTDSLFTEGLAYNWRTTNKGGTSSYSISDMSGGSRSDRTRQSNTYFPGAKFNYDTGLWEGPNVSHRVDTESAQQGVSSSAGNIANRFETKD